MRTIPNTIISIEEPSGNPAVGILERHKHGSCNICGEQTATIPALVVARYWDPDDGWTLGKLCAACVRFCREPREDDYAFGDDAFLVESPDVVEDAF